MSECDAVEAIKMITAEKKKAEPLLKKRNNQWSHEVRKEMTVSPGRVIPLFYGDRFIPRRFAVKDKDTNETFLFKWEKQDFLATRFSPSQWRYRGLKVMINNSFGVKQRRVLDFSDLASKSNSLCSSNVLPAVPTYEFIYGSLDGLDWPCVPRVKPMACAETTHDLPYFDMFSDINLIDWSVNGDIAASFGRDLVLWKPTLDLTLVYRIRNCKAIAYCPKGKFLAISSKTFEWPVFELWDHQRYKELCIYNGYVFNNNACVVLCIEWARSGKFVVGGTAQGWVYVFTSPELSVFKVLKNHEQPVFMVKFSPTMRYLATSDVEGNVYVYNWPSCDIQVVVRSKRKLRVVIDWHPWNGTDLAISEDSPASIVILHAPSQEIVACYQRKDQKVVIDFITFNRLTGELLVSYSDKDPDGCIRSEIMVMSSLDRVVDVLRVPNSCVRFMMWSPNGLQLATAGNDETLTIWNFLPNPANVTHSARRPLKKPTKTANESPFGKEFNKWTQIK